MEWTNAIKFLEQYVAREDPTLQDLDDLKFAVSQLNRSKIKDVEDVSKHIFWRIVHDMAKAVKTWRGTASTWREARKNCGKMPFV
jgi:hypothetical protein